MSFWIENPSVLLHNFNIIPSIHMNPIERLNTLTRLVIIISIILFFLKVREWLLFLILANLIIIGIYYTIQPTHLFQSTNLLNNSPILKENYQCRKSSPFKPKFKFKFRQH